MKEFKVPADVSVDDFFKAYVPKQFQEALARLERGEDPETIEQEMGDIFDGEDPFQQASSAGTKSNKHKPKLDDTLYEL